MTKKKNTVRYDEEDLAARKSLGERGRSSSRRRSKGRSPSRGRSASRGRSVNRERSTSRSRGKARRNRSRGRSMSLSIGRVLDRARGKQAQTEEPPVDVPVDIKVNRKTSIPTSRIRAEASDPDPHPMSGCLGFDGSITQNVLQRFLDGDIGACDILACSGTEIPNISGPEIQMDETEDILLDVTDYQNPTDHRGEIYAGKQAISPPIPGAPRKQQGFPQRFSPPESHPRRLSLMWGYPHTLLDRTEDDLTLTDLRGEVYAGNHQRPAPLRSSPSSTLLDTTEDDLTLTDHRGEVYAGNQSPPPLRSRPSSKQRGSPLKPSFPRASPPRRCPRGSPHSVTADLNHTPNHCAAAGREISDRDISGFRPYSTVHSILDSNSIIDKVTGSGSTNTKGKGSKTKGKGFLGSFRIGKGSKKMEDG